MMMERKNLFFLFVFTLFVVMGCSQDPRIPEGFPDKEEMATIIADVHFVEATIEQNKVGRHKFEQKYQSYYHGVLNKYNLTKSEFDSIVSWYASYPEFYESVYERVVEILSEKEASHKMVVEQIEKIKEEELKVRRARNLRKIDQTIFVSYRKKAIENRKEFSYNVDTIDAVSYRISGKYQFIRGNKVDSAWIKVINLYSDSTKDTLYHALPVNFTKNNVEFEWFSDSINPIIAFEGSLVDFDTTKDVQVRVIDVWIEFFKDTIDHTLVIQDERHELIDSIK